MNKIILSLITKLSKEEEIKTINKYKLTGCEICKNKLVEHYVKNIRGTIGRRFAGVAEQTKEDMELYLIEKLFMIVARLKWVESKSANAYVDKTLGFLASGFMRVCDVVEIKKKNKNDGKKTRELKENHLSFIDLFEEELPLVDCCFTSVVKEKAKDALDKFLNTLPAEYRTIFCYRTGYTSKNIYTYDALSKMTGVSIKSIERHSKKIRKLLSEMYS